MPANQPRRRNSLNAFECESGAEVKAALLLWESLALGTWAVPEALGVHEITLKGKPWSRTNPEIYQAFKGPGRG